MLSRTFVLIGLAAAAVAQSPPSFVILLADDLGVDGVGYMNAHPKPPPTPRLDQLASEGVVFRRAYVSPLCSPTRACMLTGLDAWRTGVGVNVTKNGAGLDLGSQTICHDLGDGWRSVMLGKWHLSPESDAPDDPPRALGFDDYRGTWRNLSANHQTYWRWWKMIDQVEQPHHVYTTTDNIDDAVEELQTGTKPLFLVVSLNAPHAPWHEAPAHLASPPPTQSPPDLYLSAIEAMDTELGRLLDELAQSTYAASTWVFFMGDNGSPSEVVRPPMRPDRVKGSVYEGGIHVPLIVRGPTTTPRVVDDLVQGTDLYATITELAGVHTGTPDSTSFVPVLRGEPGTRDHAYLEMFGPWWAITPNWWKRAVVGQRWKLIEYANDPDELYDLSLDPQELRNALEHGPGALTGEARRAYAWLKARMDAEGGSVFD
jgi:arylsulfatase A-like enzyme